MTSITNHLVRSGKTRACPQCGESITYTYFSIATGITPFFYSEAGHSVLIRKSDAKIIEKLFADNGRTEPSEAILTEITSRLLANAGDAPDGSRFTLWANIKCPKCHFEFPYDGGFRSMVRRLTDSKIPLLDGMIVVGDTPDDTYTIKVVVH